MSATAFSSMGFGRGYSLKISKVRKLHEGKPFVKCSVKSGSPTSEKTVRVGVLGARGYTGSEANLIGVRNIIIDAKSGVSGAGHSAKENLLFTEVVKASILMVLPGIAMTCGMQSTIYVEMAPGVRIEDLCLQLKLSYGIDNVVKGASGQALQNLNVMMGFPENLRLH